MRRIDPSAWLLAASSAILQILVFPRASLYFLGWICLAPLLVAIFRAQRRENVLLIEAGGPYFQHLEPATPGQAFVLGYFNGVMWYAGSCYWIYHVMHIYGGLAAPVAAGILLLFCLYLALYHGLFGALLALGARRFQPVADTKRAVLLAPFLWVAVELARARITGFPWDLLGTSQAGNIPLTRIATITGVYGLSFEILLINAAFAAAILVSAFRRRRLLVSAFVAATLLQAGSLAGPPPAATDRSATLVQENIPILEGDWTPELLQTTLASLGEFSLSQKKESSPGLIIWPESPAPFFITDQTFHRAVSEIASRSNAYVVAGSLDVRAPGGRERPAELSNSAALIAPDGTWVARYDKIHLVPFGEYVPFKSVLVFAQKLTREVGDFAPGTERTVFALGKARLAVFICYESIFPDEIRQFAVRGAQFFVNISNDGWFGESGAPEQHLNMARMRAIENRRWLLRSTNTGITASIDPYGRVVARAPRNIRTALQAPYALLAGTTFYTRHGDWFAYACAIISALALLVRFRFRAARLR